MVAPARIFVEGPYTPGGTSKGPRTPLYLTESTSVSTSTDTGRSDIPTQDDDESILSPISGEKEVSLNGVISGERARQGGYGSTKKSAFRNYLFHLETLVLAEQGVGFKLEDNERGSPYTFDPTASNKNSTTDNFGVVFDSVRWEYNSGEGFKGEWNLSGQVTDGVQNTVDRSNIISTEIGRITPLSDKITTDNTTVPLGEIEKRTYDREVDLETTDIIHNQDSPNVASIDSGVKGSLSIEGRIANHQVSQTLSDLSRRITNSNIAGGIHGVECDFSDSLTGRIFTGTVADSNADFVSGEPDKLEYRIEIETGEVPATLAGNS